MQKVLEKDILKGLLEIIKKTCFKTLLGIQPVHVKKKVMVFLVECFDEKKRRFVINGQSIDLKKLVQKIIGLPNGGKHISVDPKFVGLAELRKKLSNGGRCKTVGSTFEYMQDGSGLPDIERLIVFILQSCAYFLAPKTNRNTERPFLNLFKDVETLEDIDCLNWADFIANFLIEGIIEYKRCGGSKVCGCIHILAVSDVFSSECLE